MPNNLQRLILYAILTAVTVPLYHIVEQHRTEGFEQSTFHIWGAVSKLPRKNINVCIKLPHLPLQVNITVFSADHNSQILALVNAWDP